MVEILKAAALGSCTILMFASASPVMATEVSEPTSNVTAATPIAALMAEAPAATTVPGSSVELPAASPPAHIQFIQVPVVSVPAEATAAAANNLRELVDARTDAKSSSEDQECLAAAVYFEARGEPIEGQLAVAQVVLNRASSGRFPTSSCAVVKQPAQFSFVRKGRIPPIAKATEAWRKAVAISQIAVEHLAQQISSSVLWYHASYVSPDWGRRLTRETQIGAHIFYS